ncbi:Spo0E family sporulation regulatory protein-aspartic acid phosphatase [Acetivibrio cellulolyticus]|uniref:Spo0E family sporulation regulatory protein-aspartic acid phosphatase n=1 Tax=Acetivibrio cellulolyticus TaxID=35830 RepID=UPI0001E2C79D|nr:Spo0E family sporulation regulatory protein-aspartic acid phosphatase [Acetivibrio cellulolyticus]
MLKKMLQEQKEKLYLIILKNKELCCDEVLAQSHEVDKLIAKEQRRLNSHQPVKRRK